MMKMQFIVKIMHLGAKLKLHILEQIHLVHHLFHTYSHIAK